jgi:hypothetical protein
MVAEILLLHLLHPLHLLLLFIRNPRNIRHTPIIAMTTGEAEVV